jgi:hypothetical protein
MIIDIASSPFDGSAMVRGKHRAAPPVNCGRSAPHGAAVLRKQQITPSTFA